MDNKEYNRLVDFWCWYCIKPEYGGPNKRIYSKKKADELLKKIKMYENKHKPRFGENI